MPLANLLAPQLAKKADEIEAAIGPPLDVGYLKASAPAAKAPVYDPNTGQGAFTHLVGELQRSPHPELQDMAKRINDDLYRQQHMPAPIPNAPVQAAPQIAPAPVAAASSGTIRFLPGQKMGSTETGAPIYAPQTPGVVALPPGAVGTDETGRQIDARGRNLGYLSQQDSAIRFADRRSGDVRLDDKDAFAQSALEQMYGPHLKAMQDNRDAEGMPTDQFPAGHFDGVPADQRKRIEAGVKELMKREKGTRT